MRITPSPEPIEVRRVAPTQPVQEAARPSFSVLNDFRYLTESDKDLLRYATGEVVEPGLIGGMRVEIGDDVIDGTVASRLDDARRRLAG